MQKFTFVGFWIKVTDVMMFSRVLVDDIVEDFGLFDGNESNFEGGDDIHALLRETVL